jgi:NADPH-dependent curcumin reductase CurA
MLRLFIDPAPLGGKMPPMPLETTIPGPAVGEVIESRHPDFAVGTIVEGRFGWQHFAVSNGAGVRRVNPKLGGPENALGIGGLPGFTAYVGLEVAGEVTATQTFLISGAAGAVGSAVGALIHARGGRAVGIAGGEAKCRYLVEQIGYDAAIDRHAPDFLAQLAAALPGGADVYFDNVNYHTIELAVTKTNPLSVRKDDTSTINNFLPSETDNGFGKQQPQDTTNPDYYFDSNDNFDNSKYNNPSYLTQHFPLLIGDLLLK